MVRAIALLALFEAARHGNYRASFHGFQVWAWRQPALRASDVAIDVKFLVTLGRNMAERGTVSMQDMVLMPWRAVEATRVIERCRRNGTNRR